MILRNSPYTYNFVDEPYTLDSLIASISVIPNVLRVGNAEYLCVRDVDAELTGSDDIGVYINLSNCIPFYLKGDSIDNYYLTCFKFTNNKGSFMIDPIYYRNGKYYKGNEGSAEKTDDNPSGYEILRGSINGNEIDPAVLFKRAPRSDVFLKKIKFKMVS